MNDILGSISTIRNFMGSADRTTCNDYLYKALQTAIECMKDFSERVRTSDEKRMSDDLISRSALQEEINNFSMRITGLANAASATIMEETKKSIAKMVDEQPAAYDVDKVVEQLENERNPMYREDGSLMSEKTNIKIDKAIEIVKSGGIE